VRTRRRAGRAACGSTRAREAQRHRQCAARPRRETAAGGGRRACLRISTPGVLQEAREDGRVALRRRRFAPRLSGSTAGGHSRKRPASLWGCIGLFQKAPAMETASLCAGPGQGSMRWKGDGDGDGDGAGDVASDVGLVGAYAHAPSTSIVQQRSQRKPQGRAPGPTVRPWPPRGWPRAPIDMADTRPWQLADLRPAALHACETLQRGRASCFQRAACSGPNRKANPALSSRTPPAP
jgi:hypothetical protein